MSLPKLPLANYYLTLIYGIMTAAFAETGSVSFLPTSAIFVVVREGILTGFKVYR